MKYPLLLLLTSVCLLPLITDAQNIVVTPSQLNFGSVSEIVTDSLPVTIQNNSGNTLTVTGYRFYNTYGQPAFDCQSALPVIASGANAQIYIRFHPRHNILHNSELLILNDGKRGALRVDLTGQGHYSNSYYNASENKEQEALKTALSNITGNNYINLVYGPARDTMFMEIDNKRVNGQGATQNTIECIYTGRQAVGYTDRTDCQSTYSFNTEHTFPQGFFNSLEPMRSDLHHLFPTDDLANNTRGNLPFAVVNNPTWSNGGSKGDNNHFEPRDTQKGKSARAMLYFLIRYQNYSNFVTTTDENVLKQWHAQFVPDAVETARNSRIQVAQGNRNPFVDYPQFAERINSYINTSVAPVNYSLDLENDSIVMGNINPLIPEVYHYWIVNNGNQPVALSGFSFDNPALFFFANGTGVNMTLQPGEATNIDISYASLPAGPVSTIMYFSRQFNTSVQFDIPIVANSSATGIAEVKQENFKVYPNPFHQEICVDKMLADDNIRIMDLSGRIVLIGSEKCTDLSFLPSGTYVLDKQGKNENSRALIVKN